MKVITLKFENFRNLKNDIITPCDGVNIIYGNNAQGKTLLVSTHMIDSIDMLWDRTVIMQHGQGRANVTRGELDERGQSLEDLFFDVTEGLRPEEE